MQDGLKGPYIAVVPGARWNVKEWPLDHWSRFLKRLTDKGLSAVILGGNDDREKGRRIKERDASGLVFDYTGKTDLRQLMAAIDDSLVYLSADTGPLHIANALKKELIALFGTTSPERTGPYGGQDSAYIHLVISPTSKATPEEPLVDDPDCMARITVDAVWNLFEEVLKKVEP